MEDLVVISNACVTFPEKSNFIILNGYNFLAFARILLLLLLRIFFKVKLKNYLIRTKCTPTLFVYKKYSLISILFDKFNIIIVDHCHIITVKRSPRPLLTTPCTNLIKQSKYKYL